MTTAKIFENGRSQAVRLPKEYRFKDEEVMINKIGDIVFLMPKTNRWEAFVKAIDLFSKDYFSNGRDSQENQERESL